MGKRVLGEDRIAELLELFEDLVIDARVVVIGPAQHDDAQPVLALELPQSLARGGAQDHVVECVQRR
jgi:hypothetical protein